MHGNKRERQRDRDEGEFIGPNPPGRHRTKKAKTSTFSTPYTMIRAKNLEHMMRGSQKNAKTSIFGHFRPKRAILDSFWPKWPKR